ncbi:MAG: 1-(5-phosphoribosyl)-5-[(5-phosphoribosylamino)methylideneamino]imidazole-4-carboxamide isomerase [Candidatus Omnitrophica bacterium]|nr:1-(5-phosphoribosyl)-5-[(5-phosphoribosylamino)methylideneamino]imidazole-4-carboxamide isomerase [Candidatus Omnitrophota bacterium]
MLIIPAIDIKEGKVVRLFKGQFDKVTEYGSDPLETAMYWQALGAPYLHVVDLDGAKTGERANRDVIKRMAKELEIPLETGGGIRSLEAVRELLDAGIDRVILGTRAVEDKKFLSKALETWGSSIAVSLDCSNGFVAQRGWVETSQVKGKDFAQELARMGLKYIIYTDIARDGTLSGVNMQGLKEMLDIPDVNIIASGGVKNLDDIKALLALKNECLLGVITGKAIYEGTLNLEEALKLSC